MSLTTRPIEPSALETLAALHADAWRRERIASPLLPEHPRGSEERGRALLETCVRTPGVVAFLAGKPVGFLAEGSRFRWKGQNAVVCREYGHAVLGPPAVADNDRRRIYREMYAALAEGWVRDGIQLHIVTHFAGDGLLLDTLYRLGFGAILAENLRDLGPVSGDRTARACLRTIESSEEIVPIAQEHMGYYRASPIFLPKDETAGASLREFEESRAQGDTWIGLDVAGAIQGYFVVGRAAGDGEGALLDGTDTAQVRSAYIRKEHRGTGAGRALLGAAVDWSRARGFRRLFVEHETANTTGSAFWQRHFAPYLYVSMRYVDGCGRTSASV